MLENDQIPEICRIDAEVCEQKDRYLFYVSHKRLKDRLHQKVFVIVFLSSIGYYILLIILF